MVNSLYLAGFSSDRGLAFMNVLKKHGAEIRGTEDPYHSMLRAYELVIGYKLHMVYYKKDQTIDETKLELRTFYS